MIVIEKDIQGKEKIIAIGNGAALYPNAINPFSHNRVLFDDFNLSSYIMRIAFERATQRKVFFSPIAMIKIIKKMDSPLTEIEKMALCELLTNSGARESIILDNTTPVNLDTFDYESLRNNAYCCEERIKAWASS